ncbi:hypothetical protein POVWA2_027340 [Plasmodium ovale wallikeri]|uniref:Uncharacterized protein n=1 Tax=Plasmodium ovale wallikeri TaxID=864142 RepID=A0A1A8YWG9_PLAOA|nr:hypothetical protein POVWA2_027340 [Plasmodium ovale wallikeri]
MSNHGMASDIRIMENLPFSKQKLVRQVSILSTTLPDWSARFPYCPLHCQIGPPGFHIVHYIARLVRQASILSTTLPDWSARLPYCPLHCQIGPPGLPYRPAISPDKSSVSLNGSLVVSKLLLTDR